MQVKTTTNPVFESTKDTIFLGFFEGESKLEISGMPEGYTDSLKDALKSFNFTGKAEQQYIVRLHSSTGSGKSSINAIVLGFGPRENFTLNSLRVAVSSAARLANKSGVKELSFDVSTGSLFAPADTARSIAESVMMSGYRFDSAKSDRQQSTLEKVIISGVEDSAKKEVEHALAEGEIYGSLNVKARELVNATPGVATPAYMAKAAKKIADENGLTLTVISKSEMEKQGMNGILAVGSGSRNEPKLVILEYSCSSGDSAKTIALVGKGVCFDSGGMDIKPALAMEDMKMDKGGAVAVLVAMEAVAKLKPKVNVVAVMPFVENMVSDASYKPGDIIKTYSGKTIEVLNTDAEGRIILSDALYYASTVYKPEYLIDVATLTGAVIVALGNSVAGIMGNDRALISKLIVSGSKTYERLWELPLFDDYNELMKSDHADVKNVDSNGPGRSAGTITAGIFLSNFIGTSKWAHLDIAGSAWSAEDKGYYSKGATGFGVRLLAQFLMDYE